MYLAVNKNNQFVIFDSISPPIRYKKNIYKYSTTEEEEDFYGNWWPKRVPTGEFEMVWADAYNHNEFGSPINPKCLNSELQKMTWNDNPICL